MSKDSKKSDIFITAFKRGKLSPREVVSFATQSGNDSKIRNQISISCQTTRSCCLQKSAFYSIPHLEEELIDVCKTLR